MSDVYDDAGEGAGGDVITSQLPASSTDLPLSESLVLPCLSLYKVLTQHFHLNNLSVEELCGALAHKDITNVISDVHILLLDSLLAQDIRSGGRYSTYDLACVTKLDEVTWPSLLKLYLKKRRAGAVSRDQSLEAVLCGEYCSLSVAQRVDVLLELTSHIHRFDKSNPEVFGCAALGVTTNTTKFWFVCKRLVVYTGKDVRYYTSKDKLDELLPYFNPTVEADAKLHDQIKTDYYDIVEQMNSTLVEYVLAYKTSLNRSLQSPTKYSGITYGDQNTHTVHRKDIESMPMSALLSLMRQATDESFTFGADKLYLKYKCQATSDTLRAAITATITELGYKVKSALSWRSSSPDQVKLLRNTLLEIASKIPKYFMHDAWEARMTSWENALVKAGNAHHLAACLAFLESHMRPIIFESDWTKVQKVKVQESEERRDSEELRDSEKMEVGTEEDCARYKSRYNHNLYQQQGEDYRVTPGNTYGWSYDTTTTRDSSRDLMSPASRDKLKKCERLTKIVNKLQYTKSGNSPTKRVVSMRHSFRKVVGADGKVMFALPPGAKIIKQSSNNVTRVIFSPNSLHSTLPTPIQVIHSENNKENIDSKTESKNRNIVLSPQVVQSLLKVPGNVTIKGNVTLTPHTAVPHVDNPALLLQRLFQSWGTQDKALINDYWLPHARQSALGRKAGSRMLSGYWYPDSAPFCVPTSHNLWRMQLRQSTDIPDIAVLVNVLYAHIKWEGLGQCRVLTDNTYTCDMDTSIQRIIVDTRRNNNNPLSSQFKIVVMKQHVQTESEVELRRLESVAIQEQMCALEVGVHDLWVDESLITFNELYTYQHNQDNLKSIENAKIMEEKKKEEQKEEGAESLLPHLKAEKPDNYFVDSEISLVVRRVLTNILDRIEIEDKRDREKRGKRKKAGKKSLPVRGPTRTADEREQIRYFGKLDILLGRRKEQLKKGFFKKRQYLAHKIREDIKIEEAEKRKQEEADMAQKRRKSQEAERRKKEKEKKIRVAQDKIEKKLQKLQKNVSDIKHQQDKRKSITKSPARSSYKSPKRHLPKKSSIRIEPNSHIKPIYKNKLQPKTKFKFPPKKPVVKKSSKLTLVATAQRKPLPRRDEEKVLGKRKMLKREREAGVKRLCIEIAPVKLSKRNRAELEDRLNRYQRTIAKSLTTEDISHPVIDIKKTSISTSKTRLKTSSSLNNNIRERLQKLRKLASQKNRGSEILAKLLLKEELVKKLAAQKQGGPDKEEKKGVLQHHKDSVHKAAPNTKKKDMLYCVCKRPYDHTRFYIGCDVCSNWYHGKCVAISPSMAKKMSGYTCQDCKAKSNTAAAPPPRPAAVSTTVKEKEKEKEKAAAAEEEEKEEEEEEPEGDLFCICRTPYNQYSFYIGCDSCQEWYHGTCVGISEMEAEKIEVYICDKCKQKQGREEPKLTHIQIAGLIKILRELQMHKMSWPFREAGKSEDVGVIKEPMDLSTIHKKFQKKHYPKLTLFVKDVLRVFSNARQVYSEDSQRGRCADTLERYFVAKLNEFKLRHGLS